MKKIELIAKTKVKDGKGVERAEAYVKEHKNSSLKNGYLVTKFEAEIPETFEELLDKHDNEEILKKFNEIHKIRLQDSKRVELSAVISDKQVSLTTLIKASGLSPEEIRKRLGID